MDRKIGGFAPDLGLEYVSRYDSPAAGLPAQREAQLTGEQVRQWVGDLFRADSLEQTMRRFVSPRLPDPAILAPARFERLVQDSARELHALAADAGSNPILQQAGELLDHELRLRELLASYRGLLMQA